LGTPIQSHIRLQRQTQTGSCPQIAPRLMQMNRIRADQITQARGLADQRLRKPDTPLDPVNRRISLIVQYIEKPPEAPAASTQPGGSECTGEQKEAGAGEGQKKAMAPGRRS
jgi:hypothetical protein